MAPTPAPDNSTNTSNTCAKGLLILTLFGPFVLAIVLYLAGGAGLVPLLDSPQLNKLSHCPKNKAPLKHSKIDK